MSELTATAIKMAAKSTKPYPCDRPEQGLFILRPSVRLRCIEDGCWIKKGETFEAALLCDESSVRHPNKVQLVGWNIWHNLYQFELPPTN